MKNSHLGSWYSMSNRTKEPILVLARIMFNKACCIRSRLPIRSTLKEKRKFLMIMMMKRPRCPESMMKLDKYVSNSIKRNYINQQVLTRVWLVHLTYASKWLYSEKNYCVQMRIRLLAIITMKNIIAPSKTLILISFLNTSYLWGKKKDSKSNKKAMLDLETMKSKPKSKRKKVDLYPNSKENFIHKKNLFLVLEHIRLSQLH